MTQETSKQTYVTMRDQIFVMAGGVLSTADKLEAGIYTLNMVPMMGFCLSKHDGFELPEKIYGDVKSIYKKINKAFKNRKKTTGILLSGVKGTGKTLTASYTANEMVKQGYPVILVNERFDGAAFNAFVNGMQDAVFMFDEFDKVYNEDREEQEGCQEHLLTLLDGVDTTRKLFIFTNNSMSRVNDYFRHRPSRIYYNFEYGYIDDKEVEQYCEDYLDDMEQLDDIKVIINLYANFTFDTLQALVQDVNLHKKSAIKLIKDLNIEEENYYQAQGDGCKVKLYKDGKLVAECESEANPMSRQIDIIIPDDKNGKNGKWIYLYPGMIKKYDRETETFHYVHKEYTATAKKSTVYDKYNFNTKVMEG